MGLGVWLSSQTFTWSGSVPEHYSESVVKECCLLLGCIHYRAFPSLCTGSHCWLPGALQTEGWHIPTCSTNLPSLCLQGQQVSKPQGDPQMHQILGAGSKKSTELPTDWGRTLPAGLNAYRLCPQFTSLWEEEDAGAVSWFIGCGFWAFRLAWQLTHWDAVPSGGSQCFKTLPSSSPCTGEADELTWFGKPWLGFLQPSWQKTHAGCRQLPVAGLSSFRSYPVIHLHVRKKRWWNHAILKAWVPTSSPDSTDNKHTLGCSS
jgi:hypothetical protein